MASALKEFDWNESEFHWNEKERDHERRKAQAIANLEEMHRDQRMISIHPFLSGWLQLQLEKMQDKRDAAELLKEALLAEKFTNFHGEIEFFYYTGAGENPIAATKTLLETWLDDDICGLKNLLEFSWSTQSALAHWLRTDLNIEPPTRWRLIDTTQWIATPKREPGAPKKLEAMPIFEKHVSADTLKSKLVDEALAIQKELQEIAKQGSDSKMPALETIKNQIRKPFRSYKKAATK